MVATPDEVPGTAGMAEAEAAAAVDAAALALFAVWERAHHDPQVPVPPTQLYALFVVGRGPTNISGLAAELGMLLSSASRLCDRLEAAGLLARDPGRDRREVAIRLTGQGRALLDRLGLHRQRELARVFAEMPPPAVEALLWGLSQFQKAAARSGTPPSASPSFRLPA